MSTKTLRKRIALSTVVALGAGVLSLVSGSTANAASPTALGATTVNAAAGSANTDGTGVVGRMFVATAASTSGSAVVSSTNANDNRSVGLVNVSDIAGGSVAGTTQTAVLLSTGTLVVYGTGATSGSSAYDVVSVTGGTISSASGMGALNTASTVAGTAANASTNWAVAVKPTSGATSMTISLTAASTTQTSASGGTLSGYITVTIAASSTAGAMSTAKSGIWYNHSATGTTSTTADDTQTYDPTAPTQGSGPYGVAQYATVRVRDAYGTALTGSTGLLTATATNGAYVNIDAAGTTAKGTQSTAFKSTSTPDTANLIVSNPTTAPLSTVVTVSWNGTVIGTKSFTFTGQVAKITLSAPSNGVIGSTAAATGTATIAFADSAGNAVYPSTTSTGGSGNANYPSTGLAVDGTSTNAYVTNAYVNQAGEWPTSTASGLLTFLCGPNAGSAKIAMKYSNLDGSVVTSNALPVACSGSADTYTAALDKSSYAPGDLATLTVTFKDSKGNLANDMSAIATSTPQVAGGYLTPTTGANTTQGGTAAATTDGLTNGVKTYKFVVGAPTIDPYGGQLLVSFPTVNAGGGSANQTVTYKIVSGQTSLNDVLKGIVSLIASINKQIAALAKLVTKKK